MVRISESEENGLSINIGLEGPVSDEGWFGVAISVTAPGVEFKVLKCGVHDNDIQGLIDAFASGSDFEQGNLEWDFNFVYANGMLELELSAATLSGSVVMRDSWAGVKFAVSPGELRAISGQLNNERNSITEGHRYSYEGRES